MYDIMCMTVVECGKHLLGEHRCDGNETYLVCLACDAGRFSAGGAAQGASCDAGKFSITGSSTCESCAPGQYRPYPQSGSCLSCAQGAASRAPAATTCDVCPANTYNNALQQVNCTVCPITRTLDADVVAGAVSCTPCDAGTRYVESASGRDCVVCDAGTYQPLTGQSQCAACPVGYTTPSSPQQHPTVSPVLHVVPAYLAYGQERMAHGWISMQQKQC